MASLKSQASKGISITPLTPIDQLMPRTYVIGMVFGFRLSRRANPLEIYEHLKLGLEATIDEIPFIGGRIAPVEGSPGRYQIETELNKSDTRLIYNDIRSQSQKPWSQSYKTLSAGKFSVELLDIDVLSPIREYRQLDKPPVLSAQANFIDGGLILHVCTIHTACDVLATYNVLSVWSSKVRASWLDESEEIPSPISPASFDRSPLMHGNHNVQRMDVREFRLQQESSGFVHPRDFVMDPNPSMSDMRLTIFSISKAKLAGLRDTVSATSSSGTWVTENDALAAFIWVRINHVRYQNPETENHLTGNLVVAIDGRLRLDSPLPLTYMGNASLAFPIRLPLHPKSVSSAASDIQKSMAEFNDKHLKDTVGYLDSIGGNLTEERLSYAKTLDPTLVISNLKDMNYYGLDWGAGLGFMDEVRPAQNFGDCLPRIIPLPARRDGVIDIMVWIEKTAMARLKVDPEWCKWIV